MKNEEELRMKNEEELRRRKYQEQEIRCQILQKIPFRIDKLAGFDKGFHNQKEEKKRKEGTRIGKSRNKRSF